MEVDILTLFPKMFDSVLDESILKRAIDKGILKVKIHNLRDWTFDRHRSADDKPFGGGPGMVMKIEPVYFALKQLGVSQLASATKIGGSAKIFGGSWPVGLLNRQTGKPANRQTKKAKVILLTPQGKRLDQKVAKRLAKEKRLILICGHYEGVDERVRNFADEEISIGDYILTCGELPALVLIDAITRLLPGALGDARSTKSESFENNLLEYPQYTRPAEFEGVRVPEILLSGDHKKIAAWRRKEAIRRTRERRPDLLKKRKIQSEKRKTVVSLPAV